MLSSTLVANRNEALNSSLIQVDLFCCALNMSMFTFIIVLFDILADGWQVLGSDDFRYMLWHRVIFALLLQTEGWIISKVTSSQVQALGSLQSIIVIQVLLKSNFN